MIIKYICHKEGISPITLTVYLDGYKPIDVAWQKTLGCSVVYCVTLLFASSIAILCLLLVVLFF